MRIGIDVRKIDDTGIGRYIENLVESLLKVDEENEYVLFFTPEGIGRREYPEGRVTKVVERAGKYSVEEHITLARSAKRAGLDLFHAPHYVLPFFMRTPSVVTVHDLIHVAAPGFNPIARVYARLMITNAARRARVVIAVSEHTKKDLVALLGVPEGKIRVIPNGGGDFSRMDGGVLGGVLDRLGLAPGYFLYVGSDRPHKNLAAVRPVMERMGDDTVFVIVGRMPEERKKEFAGFGRRARFFDNVDKETMRALYSGAAALFFPSFYEGFGLPPLEAMACGAPVVASDRTSIPEVVGDAAALTPPDDIETMAELLGRVRGDSAFRDELVRKGYERVKQFSWEKTARMTLDAYRAAAR
ncbi:MAG: glycosyltransferase family 4 protein [Candidatus Nitrospinota bacterium M3_3B_026]